MAIEQHNSTFAFNIPQDRFLDGGWMHQDIDSREHSGNLEVCISPRVRKGART